MSNTRATLFDMDGTLVRVNTARLYLRWQRQRGELSALQVCRGLLWLMQYRLGVIEAGKVAQKALVTLAGRNEAHFRAECRGWFREAVIPFITSAARDEVLRHQAAGHQVAIVTAATDYAAQPLADELGITDVLSTRLEVAGGVFTGTTDGQVCYGTEKVTVARRWAKRKGLSLDHCSFYSDSITDLPLLAAVGEPIVVNPDPRLRRAASRARWPVLSWQ